MYNQFKKLVRYLLSSIKSKNYCWLIKDEFLLVPILHNNINKMSINKYT